MSARFGARPLNTTRSLSRHMMPGMPFIDSPLYTRRIALGKCFIGIAAVNVIDLRAALHDLFGDVVFKRRAAHHDRNVRVTFL